MSAELAGRVALVTGGSRGIGRAIALELARAGATVVFTYVSNAEAAAETEKAIAEAGGKGRAQRCDVADHDAVEALVARILQEHDRLDIAVNNAGIARDQLILRMKPEDFDAVIATNLRGAWSVCRAATKPMLKRRAGRVINLSSVVAQMGNPGQSNYAASKGGVEALTRSLAREVGSRGITVNAVAPGFIDTDMTRDLPDAAKQALAERIPLGRLGTAEDVARVVRFLASDAAGYVTGQVIHVNGGLD
ncbi:MAG TPA: 3-oxoacyl-ACP reductase FabG [Myxococcota bacterium]|nr:3-oxoacyl-ACP reductase FabG [Myxococcota bacterium]